MKFFDVLLFVAYTAVNTASITLVKQFARPAIDAWQGAPGFSTAGALVAAGAALNVGSFCIWAFIVSRIELSIAYPVIVGLTLVTTTIVAVLMLQESVSLLRLTGIAIIFIGVVVVATSPGR